MKKIIGILTIFSVLNANAFHSANFTFKCNFVKQIVEMNYSEIDFSFNQFTTNFDSILGWHREPSKKINEYKNLSEPHAEYSYVLHYDGCFYLMGKWIDGNGNEAYNWYVSPFDYCCTISFCVYEDVIEDMC